MILPGAIAGREHAHHFVHHLGGIERRPAWSFNRNWPYLQAKRRPAMGCETRFRIKFIPDRSA
jgi:hypothetical protein